VSHGTSPQSLCLTRFFARTNLHTFTHPVVLSYKRNTDEGDLDLKLGANMFLSDNIKRWRQPFSF